MTEPTVALAGPTPRRRRLLVVEWLVFVLAYAQIASVGATFALATISNIFSMAFGTLLVIRRPENRIGTVMTVTAWGWVTVSSADVAAERLVESGSTAAAGWVALVAMLATVPLLWLTNAVLWLIFPDGWPATAGAARLLTWSGWYLVVPLSIGVLATPQVLGPGAPTVDHPFLDSSTSDTFGQIWILTAAATFLVGLVAVGLLFARVRRVGPVERRQIIVVATGVLVYFALIVFNAFVHPLGSADERAFLLLDGLAGAVLVVAFGIAIVRYRLFEIGRIVRRSVVFGGLAALIAAIYVAIVVGVGAYYGDDADLVLSIVATVAVALAFQPARRALEGWASRLVYGTRAAPQEVLSRFARHSFELSDEELLARLPELVAQGTSARRATVWVRTDEGFRAISTWPDVEQEPMPESIDADGATFEVPGADRSVPVFQDGELLGGVSVDKQPGEPISPAESALLDDLAGALGVAMRNARLADDMRQQLATLEASRERLLTAGDDARRSLEWSLDSGPQQWLAALKVKLEPVRVQAERLGADRVANLLAALEPETELAIQSIRRFAAGVYPPELESHGLAPAIRSCADTMPYELTVRVDTDTAGRFDRDVESAVYFTVLEALQNVAKHADATHVAVDIASTPQELTFEVRDDGVGFDIEDDRSESGMGLAGMSDRLDIVGGRLAMASSPGFGTTVSGHVPLDHPVDASTDDVTTDDVTTHDVTTDDDLARSIPARVASADARLDVPTA